MGSRRRCSGGLLKVLNVGTCSSCQSMSSSTFYRFTNFRVQKIGLFHLCDPKTGSFQPFGIQFRDFCSSRTLYSPLGCSLAHSFSCNPIRLWNRCGGIDIAHDAESRFHILKFAKSSISLHLDSAPFCSSSLEQIDGCNIDDIHEGYSWSEDCEKLFRAISENSEADQRMEDALESAGASVTTETVGMVLHRLRFDEKSALRFFIWASQQEGYSHQPPTYNAMIDILSCTKYKAKQFGIVCDLLDYMKRKKRNYVPIEMLLEILRKYTEKNLTSLGKFAKKKKIRVKTKPEINAFNLLLDSLCKSGLVGEAESMFKKLKAKLPPDARTYNILFFGWCRARKPTKAMEVLEEMIQMGHTPENFTYNAAIDAFCRAGMVLEASQLFEFMRTKGSTMSSPTAKTYCIMIVALAKADRMDECFQVIADMRNSGCLPDVSTYVGLVEGMCSAGKLEEAYKFLDEMANKGYPPDILTYNCFLKVLCNRRQVDDACALLERIKVSGCLPSVQTYNMLITMFFNVGQIEKATELWNEMNKIGCPPDIDSYCTMIDGLFKSGDSDNARLFLNEIMEKRIKLPYRRFDSFLMRLSALGDLQMIHQLSEYMRRFYNHAMTRHFVRSEKRKSMSLRRK
ncbi:pentatricopeptide repeat-containing protein At1g73400, mitochondrial [Nymphaea colorata]|nr:pentatricopeptide repeat-containing protein At1g73400, mitochondrial [Nymphaea colorata]XP_031472998.1 pentatricopeptide repeat-containing protein At1g73400, mitochondrial [Nymphaea colorata]XP_031472999.1 pentatricopeptide repeat-containing protein At1g73400, mitochondrial [Nymphaea colorata]XP_031473000.1 pentatricopeptide repeat-containing protein At1g73400, mitochondrial [Nymphaea colorata]XP_031473001.1 pentatricopeptide repeat-containing protein At1g73400, mitochondrial [Nymphaea color